ncbi:MAG TPA: helix-turn-helix domain-containing protein [Epsilonproteobacteria bacterium]|nr:helix-turn-helix domain-containing protein [Campylobacterota bacterium]
MRKIKYKIELNQVEKEALEKIVRKQTTAQSIGRRARIILMANSGEYKNGEIAKYVGMDGGEITRWTKRWVESRNEDIEERLKDRPRSGRPSRITAEQWCKIMALACERPEDYGIPITHWSHSTLTAEIIKQGIVDAISSTHVGNFLKKQNYNLTEVSTG